MADHIRYDLLVREALRGVVRRVLADAARNGLAGDHHFYISFGTDAPGVRISPRLKAQYPQEMTIVLQHQFWDLAVSDTTLEVGLSFGGVPERLVVPFDAIKGFFDPSVQFGLEFEPAVEKTEGETAEATPDGPPALPKPAKSAKGTGRGGRPGPAQDIAKLEQPPPAPERAKTPPGKEPEPEPSKPGGGEVVRLDRFRKK